MENCVYRPYIQPFGPLRVNIPNMSMMKKHWYEHMKYSTVWTFQQFPHVVTKQVNPEAHRYKIQLCRPAPEVHIVVKQCVLQPRPCMPPVVALALDPWNLFGKFEIEGRAPGDTTKSLVHITCLSSLSLPYDTTIPLSTLHKSLFLQNKTYKAQVKFWIYYQALSLVLSKCIVVQDQDFQI